MKKLYIVYTLSWVGIIGAGGSDTPDASHESMPPHKIHSARTLFNQAIEEQARIDERVIQGPRRCHAEQCPNTAATVGTPPYTGSQDNKHACSDYYCSPEHALECVFCKAEGSRPSLRERVQSAAASMLAKAKEMSNLVSTSARLCASSAPADEDNNDNEG